MSIHHAQDAHHPPRQRLFHDEPPLLRTTTTLSRAPRPHEVDVRIHTSSTWIEVDGVKSLHLAMLVLGQSDGRLIRLRAFAALYYVKVQSVAYSLLHL